MQLNVRPFITGVSVVPLCFGIRNLQFVAKMSSQSRRTIATKIGVSKVDKATVSCTGVVGGGALIVSMLSAETPTTRLPKGAFLDPMTGCVLVAPEAVWENDLVSLTPLAKYSMAFQTVFSFFDIRWTLGGENTWNPIITGWNKEGGGEGGRVARRCC